MRIRRTLLLWIMRPALLVSLAAMVTACGYVMLMPGVLKVSALEILFLLAHAKYMTGVMGRFRSGRFAFLYTRGFSRTVLWTHTILASITLTLLVWLPAALLVWTGARSAFQDFLQNPYFPIMAPRETFVPWTWLAYYAAFTSMLHYAWTRRACSYRGRLTGLLLTAGVCLLPFGLDAAFRVNTDWVRWSITGATLLAAFAAVLMSIGLHKEAEVTA